MALTGLFLISFLIIHVSINACIFNDLVDPNDNGDMFNRAANFMANSVLVRTLEYGLFLGFFIHIIQGYSLEAKKSRAAVRDIKWPQPIKQANGAVVQWACLEPYYYYF